MKIFLSAVTLFLLSSCATISRREDPCITNYSRWIALEASAAVALTAGGLACIADHLDHNSDRPCATPDTRNAIVGASMTLSGLVFIAATIVDISTLLGDVSGPNNARDCRDGDQENAQEVR